MDRQRGLRRSRPWRCGVPLQGPPSGVVARQFVSFGIREAHGPPAAHFPTPRSTVTPSTPDRPSTRLRYRAEPPSWYRWLALLLPRFRPALPLSPTSVTRRGTRQRYP